MGRHSQPGSAPYLEDLLSHLSEQLCHFTQARMEMADLYEKMHSLGSQKSINSEELVTTLEAVLHKYSTKCVNLSPQSKKMHWRLLSLIHRLSDSHVWTTWD